MVTSDHLKGRDVLFSSKSNDHITPPDLFRKLDTVFRFVLDPCADQHYKHKGISINYEEEGLSRPWGYNTFINPPYSDIEDWVTKTINEWRGDPHHYYVMLLPSRTDRPWFARLAEHASAICFIKGRLKFWEYNPQYALCQQPNQAPFPSMLVVFASLYNITIEQMALLKELGTVWHIRDQMQFYPDPNFPGKFLRYYDVPRPVDLKT